MALNYKLLVESVQVYALSIGLLGMRERVTLLGGRLELRSEPDRGSWITVYIPLSGEAEGP
ncbi:MAG: hypothetical protein R3248_08150 [Candidatus Promineifilaceae bacterium]|nr:hypothetical protein [Candidatus Promineifilaceae bacterium]